jgi:4-diphosphocytidyl-2-C-methyl-D-erythritol kinase
VTVGTLAPAKINLYLHVVGRRSSDGYHLLDSLVAFADIGDRLSAVPGDRLCLTVEGPEAASLAGLGDDNLVLRAARALAAICASVPKGGAALRLDKCLPVAAGIGGSSSDAAAALRLLRRLWQPMLSDTVLAPLAESLGADVPACLAARPVWVGGIGQEIEPALGLPPAGIVLVNPRRPLPTPAVFAARRGPFSAPDRFTPMPIDAAGLADALASRRNDLTEAAISLMPEIAAVLRRLAEARGALLARMSGSGATCFALFASRDAALAAAAALRGATPDWWVKAGSLLTAPPPIEDET